MPPDDLLPEPFNGQEPSNVQTDDLPTDALPGGPTAESGAQVELWRFALLRTGLRRKEGIVYLFSRHLLLIPASRDSEAMPGYYQTSR
jgi:hypothetical protein